GLDAERFRHHGDAALASRTAGLARRRIRARRLEREASAPADGDVERVPAVGCVSRGWREDRFLEQTAVAISPTAAGCGSDSRLLVVHFRPAGLQDWRAWCVP